MGINISGVVKALVENAIDGDNINHTCAGEIKSLIKNKTLKTTAQQQKKPKKNKKNNNNSQDDYTKKDNKRMKLNHALSAIAEKESDNEYNAY